MRLKLNHAMHMANWQSWNADKYSAPALSGSSYTCECGNKIYPSLEEESMFCAQNNLEYQIERVVNKLFYIYGEKK